MDKLRKVSLIIFLLSSIPFIFQVNTTINFFTFFLFLMSILSIRYKSLRTRFVKLFLLFASSAMMAIVYQQFRSLEMGVSLLGVLATLKIIEMDTKRDFYIFSLICYLMISSHLLTIDSLYMTLYVILICFVLFYSLINVSGSFLNYSLEKIKTISKILLIAFPISVIMFFIFPRIVVGNLFNNTVVDSANTGFSEMIEPGLVSRLVEDSTVIFRSTFKSDRPLMSELYWRGQVLDLQDQMRWTRFNASPFPAISSRKGATLKHRYQVHFENFGKSSLFTLDGTLSINLNSSGQIKRRAGYTFFVLPFSNQKIQYSANSYKNIQYSKLTPKDRVRYLKYSSRGAEKFEKLVKEEIKSRKVSEFVSLFYDYLIKNKFRYSLSPGTLESDNQVDDFIFNKKLGYCEHFASSLALALRIKGIPARVVVGFLGGTYNSIGEYFTVRNKDAHAWVEAWDDEKGWISFDPTSLIAPARVQYGVDTFLRSLEEPNLSIDDVFQNDQESIFNRVKFAYDMIYYELNRLFLGFDYEEQKRIFSFFGKKWKAFLVFICLIVSILFYFVVSYLFSSRLKISKMKKMILKYLKRKNVLVDNDFELMRVLKNAEYIEIFNKYMKYSFDLNLTKIEKRKIESELKLLLKN